MQDDRSVEVVEFAEVRQFAEADEEGDVVELECRVLGEDEFRRLRHLPVVHRLTPSHKIEVGDDGCREVGQYERRVAPASLRHLLERGVVTRQHLLETAAADVSQYQTWRLQVLVRGYKAFFGLRR